MLEIRDGQVLQYLHQVAIWSELDQTELFITFFLRIDWIFYLLDEHKFAILIILARLEHDQLFLLVAQAFVLPIKSGRLEALVVPSLIEDEHTVFGVDKNELLFDFIGNIGA